MYDALSEGKCPLGKGKQVGLVHGSQRGLEAHRKAKTTREGEIVELHV